MCFCLRLHSGTMYTIGCLVWGYIWGNKKGKQRNYFLIKIHFPFDLMSRRGSVAGCAGRSQCPQRQFRTARPGSFLLVARNTHTYTLGLVAVVIFASRIQRKQLRIWLGTTPASSLPHDPWWLHQFRWYRDSACNRIPLGRFLIEGSKKTLPFCLSLISLSLSPSAVAKLCPVGDANALQCLTNASAT